MTIDTGLGLVYRENFPVAGANQSSQGFRDNFTILKRAVENLQEATATAQSVMAFSANVGSGGVVRISLGFQNNSFTLPTGSPTQTAQEGMVRHSGGTMEIHDGLSWRAILKVDQQSGVVVPGTSHLQIPAGSPGLRPTTPTIGMLRYNTDAGGVEVYGLSGWGFVSETSTSENITFVNGVATGTLSILQDPTDGTDAVNLQTLDARLSALSINLTGDVLGSAAFVNDVAAIATTVVNGGSIGDPLTAEEVRDIVGDFVVGKQLIANTLVDTGVTVYHDDVRDRLEIGVKDFSIGLSGAVSGSATISKLGNTTINTVFNGFGLQANGTYIGLAQTLNVVGATVTTNGGLGTLTVSPSTNPAEVTALIANTVANSGPGINVTYSSTSSQVKYALKPISIALTGAVTGTGTVNFTGAGSDGSVSINTVTGNLGIEVQDEGGVKGTQIKSMNFVGGGVTSSVSVDGETATVFIPNSPGNEKFLLIDNGSANTPNSRRLTNGTGIILTDEGPGGDLIISAFSDEIIAKSQYFHEGVHVTERARVNIESTAEIITEVQDDELNDRVNLRFYSLNDGWHRPASIDLGLITDKYGPSIDMGPLTGGIIDMSADMGTI